MTLRMVMIATAMLAAAAIAPPAIAQAAAQETRAADALGWLFGKFCARSGKVGAGEEVCLTFAAEPDGSVSGEWARGVNKGKAVERSRAIMRVENGRIVLHSPDQNSEYREVSRGPNELRLENVTSGRTDDGDMRFAGYRVEGDVLTLSYEYFGGRKDGSVFTRRR